MHKKGIWVTIIIFVLLCLGCDLESDHQVAVHTLSFDLNGGFGPAPDSIQAKAGERVYLPKGVGLLNNSGYEFGGWHTEKGYGEFHAPGAEFFMPNRDTTLYAFWNSNTTTFTVSYNINGATSGATPNAQTVHSGSSISLPSGNGLFKTGYTFGGWNTNTDGTGTNYNAGISYTVTRNVTLYAKWNSGIGTDTTNPTGYTYIVRFDINGGIGSAPNVESVQAGSSIILPSGSGMVKSGYDFGGWNTNSTGTGTNYNAGALFTPTGNTYFYANWESKTTYTVSFNINGGNGTEPATQTTRTGSYITLPNGSGLTRNGYTFGGWNTQADGEGNSYSGGAEFLVTGNITLYVKWNLADGEGILRLVNSGGYGIRQVYIYKWDSSDFVMSDEKIIYGYYEYREYKLPAGYYKIVLNDEYGGPSYWRSNVASQKLIVAAGTTRVVQYDTRTGKYSYP